MEWPPQALLPMREAGRVGSCHPPMANLKNYQLLPNEAAALETGQKGSVFRQMELGVAATSAPDCKGQVTSLF